MTSELWTAVDDTIENLFLPDDPALSAALADSAAAGLPEIAVSPAQGKLLTVLARAVGARRILEIGTLGGYSAICLARALPADGRLVTLELNPLHAGVARANIARAGLAERVEVRVGPAVESLRQLAAEGAPPFDLVFIDADKENYPAYLDWAVRLGRPGTVIVVDNVVRAGDIVAPGECDAASSATVDMLETMGVRPELDTAAIQTVGHKGWDGFAVAVVRQHQRRYAKRNAVTP